MDASLAEATIVTRDSAVCAKHRGGASRLFVDLRIDPPSGQISITTTLGLGDDTTRSIRTFQVADVTAVSIWAHARASASANGALQVTFVLVETPDGAALPATSGGELTYLHVVSRASDMLFLEQMVNVPALTRVVVETVVHEGAAPHARSRFARKAYLALKNGDPSEFPYPDSAMLPVDGAGDQLDAAEKTGVGWAEQDRGSALDCCQPLARLCSEIDRYDDAQEPSPEQTLRQLWTLTEGSEGLDGQQIRSARAAQRQREHESHSTGVLPPGKIVCAKFPPEARPPDADTVYYQAVIRSGPSAAGTYTLIDLAHRNLPSPPTFEALSQDVHVQPSSHHGSKVVLRPDDAIAARWPRTTAIYPAAVSLVDYDKNRATVAFDGADGQQHNVPLASIYRIGFGAGDTGESALEGVVSQAVRMMEASALDDDSEDEQQSRGRGRQARGDRCVMCWSPAPYLSCKVRGLKSEMVCGKACERTYLLENGFHPEGMSIVDDDEAEAEVIAASASANRDVVAELETGDGSLEPAAQGPAAGPSLDEIIGPPPPQPGGSENVTGPRASTRRGTGKRLRGSAEQVPSHMRQTASSASKRQGVRGSIESMEGQPPTPRGVQL